VNKSKLQGRVPWRWSIGAALLVALTAVVLLAHRERVQEERRASFYANFSDLTWTDQDGQPFDFTALAGRTVLVNFIFTRCPTVCPAQTAMLARVQARLEPSERRSLQFVSVSLDPDHDTPEALHAFAQRHGLHALPWSFVRSSKPDLERLQQRLFLYAKDSSLPRPNGHNETLWLVDKKGRLLQQYEPTPTLPDRLTNELRVLLSS
jgi:protein SCO1